MMRSTMYCLRKISLVLLAAVFVSTVSAFPNPGELETGLSAGFWGPSDTVAFGLGRAGGVGFAVSSLAGIPWTSFAPFGELRLGAGLSPRGTALILKAEGVGGLACIPGTSLAAPYGGLSLGLELPVGRSGFSLHAQTVGRFGGREYRQSVSNPVGIVRYVETWAPPAIDLEAGFSWSPR
jgi:hypothetical protein